MSVYSLVLMDDVVAEIDRLAYNAGTSRSNMINRILAEYCSFTTPEKRMKDIFGYVDSFFNQQENFQVLLQPCDAMLWIKSALRYKYRPTIRYAVQLYQQTDVTIGELRVSFRTQNQQLITSLNAFFGLWAALEEAYLGAYFQNGIPFSIESGKYVRQFIVPREADHRTAQAIGEAIADYIQRLDRILKIYFANLETLSESQLAAKCEQLYRKDLQAGIPIL